MTKIGIIAERLSTCVRHLYTTIYLVKLEMGYSEVGLSHWDSLTQEEIK